MADSNAIVFPDEVEEAKAAVKAEEKVENGDSNTIEEAPVETPKVALRNMISVPPNCPPGQQMGADGVCRVVFN